MLSFDDILAAKDLGIERVSVPEWSGEVCVRRMSVADRDAWESYWSQYRTRVNGDDEDFGGFHAVLVAHTLCDESGRMLAIPSDDVVDKLKGKSASAIVRVAREAMRINGIGNEAEEEMIKNSEGDQNGSPGGDSRPS